VQDRIRMLKDRTWCELQLSQLYDPARKIKINIFATFSQELLLVTYDQLFLFS